MRRFPKPFYRPARRLWYVQIGGRQINLGADEADAHRRYHQLMGQPAAAAGPAAPTGPPVGVESVLGLIDTFLGWCEKNKARRTYEWYLAKTTSFARSVPRTLGVDQLKPFHVHDWVDAHPHWAPGMKRACMTAVQRVFNWAVRQGRLSANPIRFLEKPPGGRRDVVISPAEYERILRLASSPDFRDLLAVCWETGCRPQEVVAVAARHVDLANARWVFPPEESKGKRRHRVVYLTPAALEITRQRVGRVTDGPIFRNSDGRPWRPHALACAFGRVQIAIGREALKRSGVAVDPAAVAAEAADLRKRGKDRRGGQRVTAGELAGIARRRVANRLARASGPKYCLYHFRHSWATRALERGVDAVTVAVLMGHTDTRMLTRVYQHLSQNPAHLRSAVGTVNGSPTPATSA